MTSPELLLSEFAVVSLNEIASSTGFSARKIEELIELGVLEPCGQQGAEAVFPARCIELARAARRLQRDFELPLAGAALALAYRERIRELEDRLRLLECLLPRHVRG